jgi:hypothetical protein
VPTTDNTLRATLTRNRLDAAGPAVAVQAAARVEGSRTEGNRVSLRLLDNRLEDQDGHAVIVSQGLAGNHVAIESSDFEITHSEDDLLG